MQYQSGEFDHNYGPYPYTLSGNPEKVVDETANVELSRIPRIRFELAQQDHRKRLRRLGGRTRPFLHARVGRPSTRRSLKCTIPARSRKKAACCMQSMDVVSMSTSPTRSTDSWRRECPDRTGCSQTCSVFPTHPKPVLRTGSNAQSQGGQPQSNQFGVASLKSSSNGQVRTGRLAERRSSTSFQPASG